MALDVRVFESWCGIGMLLEGLSGLDRFLERNFDAGERLASDLVGRDGNGRWS
jgi:hypothetical protein